MVLKNQRWELFAQARASGSTQAQACEIAGFSAKTASSQGCRLNAEPEIATRICELQLLNPIQNVEGVDIAVKVNPESIKVYQNAEPFVRARIADRAYRMTVLQEMLDELRAPNARVSNLGNISVNAYREARECMKQAAIEIGDWDEQQTHRFVKPIGEDLSKLTPDQLFQEQAILNEAIGRIEAIRAGAKPLEIEGAVEEVVSEDVRSADLERE